MDPMKRLTLLVLLVSSGCARRLPIPIPSGVDAKEYVWVARLGARSATLAWGSTKGSDSIGRSATAMAAAEVVLNGRTLPPSDHNFRDIDQLDPDTEYNYAVRLSGRQIGNGSFRTWPSDSQKLTFFVIGDYGNDSPAQYRVATAMRLAMEQSADPVRFVITTGDNVYGDISSDAQWDAKFFHPYRPLIARIPFYASPGNHDGDESQIASNLTLYLDNFFFPSKPPAGTHAVYSFRYGALAEFFALDSTENTPAGRQKNYTPDGPQSRWLAASLPASTATWKIPYFHHPIWSAGPTHVAKRGVDGGRSLTHWADLFERSNVAVVFSGHEHNLQYTDAARTGGTLYVVSGAGGELRSNASEASRREHFIADAASQVHFLKVEIDGRAMRIHPLTLGAQGGLEPVAAPLAVPARF